jgi:hypothetical protein
MPTSHLASEPSRPKKKQLKTAPVKTAPAREVLIDGVIFSVAEGDLLLDPDEHQLYLQRDQAPRGTAPLEAGESRLLGISQEGKQVRWAPGTVLSYCVLRNTFPRDEWYQETVRNMRAACQAWEQTCGILFSHEEQLDNQEGVRPAGVIFPVRYISANGAFLAASFFPNDPKERRRLLIDPSYFSTTYDHNGVLRHELGHVLGFRHEHIRSGAPAVCPHESLSETVDLTAYDPQSCMHYFCGGVGSKTLQITKLDREGAQRLYGPSFSEFELVVD